MSEQERQVMQQALDAHLALRQWINAVPDETPLPAMPGIDGDWLYQVESSMREALASPANQLDDIDAPKETETIDKLFLELAQFTQAKTNRDLQFDKLLYAVCRKFPGETRFETALRYIREAEANATEGSARTNYQ